MIVRVALLAVMLVACGGSQGSASGGSTTTSSEGGADAGAMGTGASAGSAGSGVGGAVGACASCDSACVDRANDAANCGACGHACPEQQHCDHGVCKSPSCLVEGPICPITHLCCGQACCPPWKTCCHVPGGSEPVCVSIDAGACPTTCATCP